MDYYAVATVSIDTPAENAYNLATYAYTSSVGHGFYVRIVATIPGTFAFAVPLSSPGAFAIYVISKESGGFTNFATQRLTETDKYDEYSYSTVWQGMTNFNSSYGVYYYLEGFSKLSNLALPVFDNENDGFSKIDEWEQEVTETDPYAPIDGEGDIPGGSSVAIPSLPPMTATSTGIIGLFAPSSAQMHALADYMWTDFGGTGTDVKEVLEEIVEAGNFKPPRLCYWVKYNPIARFVNRGFKCYQIWFYIIGRFHASIVKSIFYR